MTVSKAKYRGWGDAPAETKEVPSVGAGATMRALRNLNMTPAEEVKPTPAIIPETAEIIESNTAQSPSPTPNTSLVDDVSLVPNRDYAHRGTRLTYNTRLTPNTGHKQNFNFWGAVDELHTGHLQLYNIIVDSVFPHLSPFEQAIYVQLYRLSWGYGKDLCHISLPRLAERAGMKQTAAQQAVKRLVEKGLIEKTTTILGRGKEQGNEFRVVLPASLVDHASLTRNTSLVPNTTIKYNVFKNTHTNTDENVRVCSKFSLAECRRYAESLRKDGITNPGGFATKIHRSGEADALIAAFISPAEETPPIDASQCPDCRGTGFWEPGGAGKGVAKCRHDRLPS